MHAVVSTDDLGRSYRGVIEAEGLTRRYGERLAGRDVRREPSAARRLIGVVPEEANVYADLTWALSLDPPSAIPRTWAHWYRTPVSAGC